MLPIVPKDTDAGQAPQHEDPVAELRRLHASVIAQNTETFPIGGYDGRLHVRYKVLDPDVKRAILNAPDQTTEQAHAQLLIKACDEILWRYENGEIGTFPGGKVTYAVELGESRSLAELFAWDDITSVAAAVLRMFGDKPEVMNLHAIAVDRWMRTLYDQADAAVVGGQPVTR